MNKIVSASLPMQNLGRNILDDIQASTLLEFQKPYSASQTVSNQLAGRTCDLVYRLKDILLTNA